MTKKIFLILLLFYSVKGRAETCESGLDAFRQTVHLKVRRDCARCHDGSRTDAPPFAVVDVNKSYEQLLNYMNFSHIEDSLLVIRAGNSHCGLELCEEESGLEMKELAKRWWSQGESTCSRNGKYFTAEISIPKTLPSPEQGYHTMVFDLSSLRAELKDVKVQIEIQNYWEATESTKGAYRVRAPRLIGGSKAIRVKDLKVLLNGKYDPIYNAYVNIDKSVAFSSVRSAVTKNASPVLSAHSMILLKDGLDDPKLSLSFVILEPAVSESACTNLEVFSSEVLPFIRSQSCANCHNQSANDLGTQILSGNRPNLELCQISTALLDKEFVMNSALIRYPVKGAFGHQALPDLEQSKYVDAIKKWLR